MHRDPNDDLWGPSHNENPMGFLIAFVIMLAILAIGLGLGYVLTQPGA